MKTEETPRPGYASRNPEGVKRFIARPRFRPSSQTNLDSLVGIAKTVARVVKTRAGVGAVLGGLIVGTAAGKAIFDKPDIAEAHKVISHLEPATSANSPKADPENASPSALENTETTEPKPSLLDGLKKTMPWRTPIVNGAPLLTASGEKNKPNTELSRLLKDLPADWAIVFSPTNNQSQSPESGMALKGVFNMSDKLPADLLATTITNFEEKKEPVVRVFHNPDVTIITEPEKGVYMFGPPAKHNAQWDPDQFIALDGTLHQTEDELLHQTQIRAGSLGSSEIGWEGRYNNMPTNELLARVLAPEYVKGIEDVLGGQPFWITADHYQQIAFPNIQTVDQKVVNGHQLVKVQIPQKKLKEQKPEDSEEIYRGY